MSLITGGRDGGRVVVLPLPAVDSLGVLVVTLWDVSLFLAFLASIACKVSCREWSSSDSVRTWEFWSLFIF